MPEEKEKLTELTVRWTAVYETKIKVKDPADVQEVRDAAADIDICIPGSEYQSDTFEVEKVTDSKDNEVDH